MMLGSMDDFHDNMFWFYYEASTLYKSFLLILMLM